MIKLFSAAALVLILVPAAPAFATAMSSGFVQNAMVDNQYEISAGRLALQNSQNDDIKAFAQEMVDEHSQIAAQLKSALAQAHVGAKATPALDAAHRKLISKLNAAQGDDFDNLYVKNEVAAHKDASALFHNYASHGDNVALKDFAAKNSPTLDQHQQQLDDLAETFD